MKPYKNVGQQNNKNWYCLRTGSVTSVVKQYLSLDDTSKNSKILIQLRFLNKNSFLAALIFCKNNEQLLNSFIHANNYRQKKCTHHELDFHLQQLYL